MRCARRCGDARRRRLHNGSKGFWVAPGQSEAGEPHRDTFEKRGPWSPLPKSGAERKVDERSVGYAIARRATPSGPLRLAVSRRGGRSMLHALAFLFAAVAKLIVANGTVSW